MKQSLLTETIHVYQKSETIYIKNVMYMFRFLSLLFYFMTVRL